MKRNEKYRRLRALRADRDWTQLQLGLKAKITASRISLIENGWVDPTDDEKDHLAKAFELPTHDVFPAPESIAS